MNSIRSVDTRKPYQLNREVFSAGVGDGVILLDLNRDRYVGVPEQIAAMLQGLIEHWPFAATHPLSEAFHEEANDEADKLLRNGYLCHSDPSDRTRPAFPTPTAALNKIDLFKSRIRPKPASGLRFALAYVRSLARYRSTSSLRTTVGYLRKRACSHASSEPVDELRLMELMAQFVRFRALTYTLHDHCLLDCLVLSEFLRLHAIRCTFVLGVRSRPFKAHCWLQSGGLILNETREMVSYYSPILSVEG